jgi:phage terminase Nu1 subunit (DNA packaging protein)
MGCPKIRKAQWDLAAIIAWWAENIYEPKIEAGEKDESLKNARQKYWAAKAEKEEINVSQLKGELIPKKTLSDLWGSRVVEVKQGLLNLSDRLPPVLEGKTQPEIREVVHKEIIQLLEMYSRNGKYTPRPKRKYAKRKIKKK